MGACRFHRVPGDRRIDSRHALHTLMRRGQATRVTSLVYLTPIFAVVLELALFGVVPTGLSIAGILITCLGVAMVSWRTPA